jgi:hypothetical protein
MATNYQPKEDLVRAIDFALENIVSTFRDTTLTRPDGSTTTSGRLSRYDILRLMARRAMRKSVQHKQRAETREARTLGVADGGPYG